MRAIITSITFFCCLFTSAQNIFLDPYFGNDGISFVENTTEITRIIQNLDGSIISAGYKIANGGGYHLSLTKHNADGTQDNNFGTGGIANTSIAYSDMILDLRLQADGKILVAGSAYLGPGSGSGGIEAFHAFIVRYHPNGIIDSSFATNGIFLVPDYNDSQFTSIIVQSDQSLLLIGNADNLSYLTRLTSAGVLDNTFGTNGTQTFSNLSTNFFSNSAGIRLSDGTLLCYGLGADISGSQVTCLKIDSLGNMVTSYGQSGKASFDLDPDPNTVELLSKAQELPDGTVILAGYAADQVVLKLKTDGTLDSTFASNGVLNHNLPFKDMLVQPNGKILIGGNTMVSASNYGVSVSRFNSDGTTDTGFNGTGTFVTDLSERSDILQSMILTGPDHLLIGGGIRPFDFNSIFGLAQIDMSESLGLTVNKYGEFCNYPNTFSDKMNI